MGKGKYKEWITDEGLVKIEGWARDGLTDEQIAMNIGIIRTTLYDWKKKYPDISNALKKGKEVVDRQVENSLLKKALGTTVTDRQYKMVRIDKDRLNAKRMRFINEYKLDHPEMSKQELMMAAAEAVPTYERIQMYETTRELPPDVTAAMFWLKNRKPEQYRDQSFRELNDAQAEKARVEVRKAIADAKISEFKAKELEEKGADLEDMLSDLIDTIKQEDKRDESK
ncbi:terminase [Pediococcus stilesii]|uniref:terminase n=1 Tax=Pediococcus stilesii TaxID=331679 RepID=UPI001BB27063|nr:terminase [Pediococcus stilesii]